jgi:hypothetical protein
MAWKVTSRTPEETAAIIEQTMNRLGLVGSGTEDSLTFHIDGWDVTVRKTLTVKEMVDAKTLPEGQPFPPCGMAFIPADNFEKRIKEYFKVVAPGTE